MKTCGKCGREKPVSEFAKKRDTVDGRSGCCKSCKNAYDTGRLGGVLAARKHRYSVDKEYKDRTLARCRKNYHADPDAAREYQFKKKYNITLKDYNEMLEAQGRVCAICGGVNEDGRVLYIDHDHITGKVRLLLCTHCNSMLGYARDNPAHLRSAIRYLERWGEFFLVHTVNVGTSNVARWLK